MAVRQAAAAHAHPPVAGIEPLEVLHAGTFVRGQPPGEFGFLVVARRPVPDGCPHQVVIPERSRQAVPRMRVQRGVGTVVEDQPALRIEQREVAVQRLQAPLQDEVRALTRGLGSLATKVPPPHATSPRCREDVTP